MKLAPVADRLKALAIFKSVNGVTELADIATRGDALPAAYVTPLKETWFDDQDGTLLIERGVIQFGIVVVMATGAQLGIDALEDLEAPVIGSLFAWAMPGSDRPLKFRAGALFGIGPGRVSRLLTFEAVSRLRQLGPRND